MPDIEMSAHKLRCEQAKLYFGSRVQSAREKRGWSQTQLAKRIGCSASVISRIERAARPPTGDQVFMLCSTLSLSVYEMVETFQQGEGPSTPKLLATWRTDLIGLIRLKIDLSYGEMGDLLKLIDLDAADDASLHRIFRQLWDADLTPHKTFRKGPDAEAEALQVD